MENVLVSIGIVTWNSAEHLKTCLDGIQCQNYAALELVVVDNNSKDDSLEIVKKSFPNATIILNNTNRGYCGGHNQGINASKGDYYLPLNPDVIIQPGYIANSVSVMENDATIGMVATKLYLGSPGDYPRRIDTTGLFMDRRRRQYLRGHSMEDKGQYDQPGEVFGVDGAAPLYRRAMLEDICIQGEYFDEAFFAHKEDVDLSWRARLLGWRCEYTPQAVAYHLRNFRPGKREHIAPVVRIHAIKNRYLLLLKNETLAGLRRDFLFIFWYDIKILGYLLFFERPSLGAIGEVKRLWKREKAWRVEIMNKKRVGDLEILNWFK